MKILCKLHDGVGDIILAMPSVKVIRDTFPKAEITAYPHSRTREGDIRHTLLKSFGYFDKYIFNLGEYTPYSEEGTMVKKFYSNEPIGGDDEYDLYITNVYSPRSNAHVMMGDIGLHLLDIFSIGMIKHTLRGAERIPDIRRPKVNFIKTSIGYDKYITIEYSTTDKKRAPNKELYLSIITFLRETFPNHAICFVGDKNAYDIEGDGCFLFRELSYDNLIDVLDLSSFHFGIESGLTTLIGALGNDLVYIKNPSSPYNWASPLKSIYIPIFLNNIKDITPNIICDAIGKLQKFKEEK